MSAAKREECRLSNTIAFVNGSTVTAIGTDKPTVRSPLKHVYPPFPQLVLPRLTAFCESQRKPYVGIDLDETLNNLIRRLLIVYNEKYNDNVAFSDITSYNILPLLKPECTNVFKEFCTDDFIRSLYCNFLDIAATNILNEKANVLFVTAAFPYTVLARHQWLEGLFPWYDSSRLVICRDKSLLKLDYLIDDCADNFTGFEGKGVLIDKPWNQHYLDSSVGLWLLLGGFHALRANSVAEAVPFILKDIEIQQKGR